MSARRGANEEYGFRLKQQLLISDCCLLIAISLGFMIVVFRKSLVPSRFMSDERTIQGLAQGRWSSAADGSYTQVSTLYRLLGLADNEMVAGLLGFSLACIPYLMVMFRYRSSGSDIIATVSSIIGILLSAVYLGSYSKEAFIMPIIVAFLTLRHNKLSTLMLCMLIAAYAYNFRTYWFLVLLFFLTFTIIIKKVSSGIRLLLISLISVFSGSILFGLILGVPADYYRMTVNVQRSAIGDVNTLIPRFVEFWGPLDGPINNTLSLLFLQFPIPLLLKFSPYYIILFVVLSALWICFYRSASHLDEVKTEESRAILLRAVLFIMAFTITQAFFEPDYGSALKHLTPFFPLLVLLQLCTRVDPSGPHGLKGIITNDVKI